MLGVITHCARRLISKCLDVELSLMSNLPVERKVTIVKERLQNFPYWRGGHLLFANQGLLKKQIAESYGAAQAVLLLSQGNKEKAEALHLIARTMIASHQPARALDILKSITESIQHSPSIQEDIAACHLALEQDEEAKIIFNKIGREKLSPEGRAMLSYLQKKSTNKLYE